MPTPEFTDQDKFFLMAEKVVWALKNLKAPGSGMMMLNTDIGGVKITHWTSDFCDALQKCGITVDRDALYGKKKSSKSPPCSASSPSP